VFFRIATFNLSRCTVGASDDPEVGEGFLSLLWIVVQGSKDRLDVLGCLAGFSSVQGCLLDISGSISR